MTAIDQVTSTTAAGTATSWWRRLWPPVAAVGLAGLTALDLAGGADLAPILAASGLIYLGAAAFQRPASAWPLFFGTVLVLKVSDVVGGPDATWILLGIAVLLTVYGVIRGPGRTDGLPLQALAMTIVGAAAAAALLVGGAIGGYLVAAGLLGHAAWDTYHHRKNRVVARSLAEFCLVLDTLLAIALLVVVVPR
jgi:hypothetical protein